MLCELMRRKTIYFVNEDGKINIVCIIEKNLLLCELSVEKNILCEQRGRKEILCEITLCVGDNERNTW